MRRPNRFLVVARIGGQQVRVACRDPGRLRELLVPDARLLVAPSAAPDRRTAYTLFLVGLGRQWIPLVPALANRVFDAALRGGGVPGLAGARVVDREVAHGRSRFDFVLSWRGRRLVTEVKSVTLVEGRRALFPDAPTARGARHVRELTPLGRGAAVVFIVQRPDADSVSPHAANDPEFAAAVAEAARAGVRLLAYTCRVSRQGVALDRRVPVML